MSKQSLRDSAILMMALGEDAASEVFKCLNPKEVQELGAAMAKLTQLTRNDMDQVLEDFREEADQFMAVTLDSSNYIRSVLTKALGSDRAAGIIEDILDSEGGSDSGIDTLNWLDASSVAELIADEHPQIIATILVHLERDRAADILVELNDRLRDDVVLRIATFGGVQPNALHELTEVLNGMLTGQSAKRSKMGGPRTAAEMLNYMNTASEEAILNSLRSMDADLTERIVEEMFVFDNLLDLEDSAIQLILKEVETTSLTVALKGAAEELREKFFKNMSNRAADMLREDIEAQGPIRISRVEEEQKVVVEVARRLAESDQITLTGLGSDEYV